MGRDDTGLHIDNKNSDMDNDKSSNSTSPVKADEEKDMLGLESTNNEHKEKKSAHNGTVDSDSPKSANESESNNLFMSEKRPNHKNYHDEEDNWSLASSYPLYFLLVGLYTIVLFFPMLLRLKTMLSLSIFSTATSARNKVTVPVAPRFTCVDRLERRKEFYTKLEEKHKALEKEKLEYESRTKEEEQAAIKQLRKNMVVRAKPVPSFYHEGPPPKVELKKLPVTRAKSPNLTRRKSCGDAVQPSPDCGRASRHSIGPNREVRGVSPVQRKASPVQRKASPVQRKASPVQKKASPTTNGSSKKVKNQSKDAPENSCIQEDGGDDVGVVES